ncbi:MAG: hypothetical protein O2960_25585 [Verrucomicrobia bacterium]|jgi:hypothetical protein|nr:hypothetical protein [Verrucomicrobiota bacterium]
MKTRAWNLLLTGIENGIVGKIDDNFKEHPKCFERVKVVEIRELLDKLRDAESLEEVEDIEDELERLL